MRSSLIGNKAFYKRVLSLVIPIAIQTGITNFVNMLDNVMVGRVGTVQMTGTSVANQLIFIFNLCIFGAVSGVGIFGAQFYGNRDTEGFRQAFRFRVLFCTGMTLVCIAVLGFYAEPLIGLYLKGDGTPEDIALSLHYGKQYLYIMLIGLLPYSLAQAYSSALRETDKATPPMVAGVAAVLINLILNYILIFGKFGAPKMGVAGAAVATVVSRYAELAIVVLWTHLNPRKNPFIIGVYRSFYVSGMLIRQMVIKALPLMLNETMWSFGIAMTNQCYSVRGLAVVPANNISQTFINVFSVAFWAVGQANGIILGQILGSGAVRHAKNESRRLIAFSVFVAICTAVIYFICAGFIPKIYNTEPEIQKLATNLMRIGAFCFPVDAFAHSCYFTLRSGGKTLVTILFDSCFVCLVTWPVAFLLCCHTALPLLTVYAICQATNLIKCVIGGILVHKGIWIQNIVS